MRKYLAEHCKPHLFALGIDTSIDRGLENMNPKMVKIFDLKRNKTQHIITTNVLDICLKSGNDCETAKTLFTAIENKLTRVLYP